jgi:hypothetical protein
MVETTKNTAELIQCKLKYLTFYFSIENQNGSSASLYHGFSTQGDRKMSGAVFAVTTRGGRSSSGYHPTFYSAWICPHPNKKSSALKCQK